MPADHAARRRALSERLHAPVLLVSNGVRYRNLPLNHLPFRADSTFLYFTGCAEPGAVALIVEGHCTLFLTPPAEDDALWHGVVDTLEDRRRRYGVDEVLPLGRVESATQAHYGRLLTLAVPDPAMCALATRLTGHRLGYPGQPGPDELVDAVIHLRRTHDAWEIDQMRAAAAVAAQAHHAAMCATRPGEHERGLAALFDAVLAAHGATPSYRSIVTVRGEILHNPDYPNPLRTGDLLLLDGGAEVASGHASDVTRTWPVSGRFDPRQRDVYQLVLEANLACVDAVRAGARYADIHWLACRVLAEGLRHLGLLRCDTPTAVETGAVGLFFPHGVGHLIGMDVHDLENFGDRPAYAPGRSRPLQFGARYLRLDLDLAPDMVVTIEPGLYFAPAILRDPSLRAQHAAHVDFARAEAFLGFGGVRIEDDVRVTAGDPEVLTAAIPKTIADLEALVGTGPSALERLSA